MEKYDVIVVGAGPAGLLAAGRAAELGGRVLVLEKMRQEGRKLLITGKGRCNITNNAPISDFITHVFPNGKFLRNAFSHFFSTEIIDLLNKYGVETTLERGGRYFPTSNKASDVLKGLLKWVKKQGVKIQCNRRVEKLIVKDKIIIGIQANGQKYMASKIILATGGKSYPATGSNGEGYELAKTVGHKIETVRPALVPLEIEGNYIEKLKGLNLRNIRSTVWINGKKVVDHFGEMSFTEFGISGPIILTQSRLIVDELRNKNKVELSVDLKPALDDKKLDNRLIRDLNEYGKLKINEVFRKWMPAALVDVFIEKIGLDKDKVCNQIAGSTRKRIKYLLKNFPVKVVNFRPFKEAIITAGGIPTQEISPKTMESKLISGLYFVGEIIDLDAETGGYNLQIAYSTGWLAGESCMLENK